MYKALLYIAGGINLSIGGLLLLVTLILGFGTLINIPMFILLITGGVFVYAASAVKLNRSFNKWVLISAIFNVFTCNFISFILGIIGFAYLPNKSDEINDAEAITKKVVKELSPEEKEAKKMRNILGLGVGLIVLAGVVFATSTWETISGSGKTITLVLAAILFCLISILAEKKLNLKVSGMTYYVLSNVLFVVSIISAGYFEVFGNWFSLNGAGSNLFLAVLWLIIGSLFGSLHTKYKIKNFLYAVCFSVISVIYFGVLAIGLQCDVAILILSIILACGALYEKNDILCKFSRVVLPFVSIGLFKNIVTAQSSIIINLISFIVVATSCYYLAMIVKNEFYKVFAPLSTVLNAVAISLIGQTKSEVLLLQIALIALCVYSIGYYKKNSDKLIFNVSSAIANLTWLYVVFDSLNLDFYYLAVVTAFVMLGVSIIISLDKNSGKYHYEKIIEPLKVLLFVFTVCKLVETLEIVGSIPVELIFLITFFVMYFIRRGTFKFVYFVLTFIVSFWILLNFSDKFAPIVQLMNLAILSGLLVNVLNSAEKKYINCKEVLYISLLLAISSLFSGFIAKYENLGLYCALGIAISYMIMFVIVRGDYLLKLITTLAMILPYYMALDNVVDIVINNTNFELVRNMDYVFSSIPWLVMIIVYTRGFLKSVEYKYVKAIEISALVVWYLGVLRRVCPEVGLFIGIVALVSILVGYKSEKYVAFYYTGIVFTILNLLIQLKDLWSVIPIWAYILVAGLILIGVVTYKEYSKSNPKCEEVVPDIIEPGNVTVKKAEVDKRTVLVGNIIYVGILIVGFISMI